MRRSLKYGLSGVVVAGVVVGATAAFAAGPTESPKTVRLVVDGTTRTISTTADDVSEALAQAGLRPTAHDIVAPGLASPLTDNETVVVKRGRLLRLTVDGQAREVWTTAPTVAVALADLGYSTSDYVSVSRAHRLPLGVTSLQLRSPKQVLVVHDHRVNRLVTTDATVAAVLRALHLKVGTLDRLYPTADHALSNHMRIVLQRVRLQRMVKHHKIKFRVVHRRDAKLIVGRTDVTVSGSNGMRKMVYSELIVDGKRVRTTLVRTIVARKPRNEVIEVGTKPKPKPKPKRPTGGGGSGGGGNPPVPAPPAGLDWDAVAQCESGGDWSIDTGNGFYGGLQFTESTWLAYGGGQYAQYPNEATKDEQIAIATKLYDADGSSPWPVCGQYL